jgi:hypothetical protein
MVSYSLNDRAGNDSQIGIGPRRFKILLNSKPLLNLTLKQLERLLSSGPSSRRIWLTKKTEKAVESCGRELERAAIRDVSICVCQP